MPLPLVLLLKDPDLLYERALSEMGYETKFISLLNDQLINQELLDMAIIDEKYWAIVVTSKRASLGLKLAIEKNSESIEEIRRKIIYVVGQATSQPLLKLGLDIQGSETGDGTNLSQLIISQYTTNSNQSILILQGDKNRPELTQNLIKSSIPFDLLQIYLTLPNPSFEKNLNDVIAMDWVIFFSPSGVDIGLDFIKNDTKIGAIGKTTKDYLNLKGRSVKACPIKPNSIDLAKAILEADQV